MKPRYQLGDPVWYVAVKTPMLVTVTEIDTSKMTPHYVLSLRGLPVLSNVPEFHLAPIVEEQTTKDKAS